MVKLQDILLVSSPEKEEAMPKRKYPPTRDRRDVGQVVFLSEKMDAAREFSSCCVGTEAALETDTGFKALTRQLYGRDKVETNETG